MNLQRKLEIFDQNIALIERADDGAVAIAALEECEKRIAAAKQRIADRTAAAVGAATSQVQA